MLIPDSRCVSKRQSLEILQGSMFADLITSSICDRLGDVFLVNDYFWGLSKMFMSLELFTELPLNSFKMLFKVEGEKRRNKIALQNYVYITSNSFLTLFIW